MKSVGFLMPIVKGFRRFHSNILSSRQAATEISNLVSGSNVEQSGRASAASLTSNRPIRKRINIAERRERLESFVNKYRAMNLGKFPSPTTAKKEVGGGYYSVKKMLQEMEYNFKMSSVEKGPTTESLNHVEKGPTTENLNHVEKGLNMENINQVKDDDFLSQEIAMASSASQEKSNTDSGNNNITSDDTQKIATESDEKPEQNPRDDNFALKDPEPQVEKQPDGIRNVMRDKGEEDNELREKASLWGNLKSMANEFINMWKK
ncbi:hypothetical protein M8C21_000695 [Ambrosia artemisiifolia]|uniref:AT3G52170-like helix-turn-helix domain-containing protein n=1 Tax=Ambrosia artemisiifolia TaxID=4212 RepID=A0AAD5CFR4_AMBAR|nr:hypothetical protein M8C21_000695 [Ambrosia artemisiifolia]